MAAIAAITITDGTTPLTFNPVAVTPESKYKDTSAAGVPSFGQKGIRLQVTEGKNGTSANRTRLVLEFPVMEVQAGGTGAGFEAAPAVAHTVSAVVDFWSSKRATPAQLTAIRKYLIAALANAQVIDAVDNRIPPL